MDLSAFDWFLKLAEKLEKVYGPYTNSRGRKIVILKRDDGTYRTVSYPKYLMEQQLGRELGIDETVDHFNSDKDDNSLDNLRVMPRAEHSRQDTRRVRLIDLNCDLCGKAFQRSPRVIRDKAKRDTKGYFCSRSCAGVYGRKLQLNQMEEKQPQQPVDSVYYKLKYENQN
jgi:hypothetical protein